MSQQPIELRENRRPGEFVESQDINQIAQAINHLASRSGTYGTVKAVNGATPDVFGNVDLGLPDLAQIDAMSTVLADYQAGQNATDATVSALLTDPTSTTRAALARARPIYADVPYVPGSPVLPVRTDDTRIGLWGSSSAERIVSAVASAFPDQTVIDGGKGGLWTGQIAARLGSNPFRLTFPANTMPASGTVAVAVQSSPNNGFISSWAPITGKVGNIPGTLDWQLEPYSYTFTRTHAGTATAVPAGTPFVPDKGESARDAVTLLWMGKNDLSGGRPATEVIAATDRAFDWLVPLQKRALVLGHFMNTGRPADAPERAHMNAVHAAHRARYGPLFIDVGAYLTSAQVWEDAGIAPTQADLDEQAMGNKPPSLSLDDGHLNAAGYAVVAALVRARMETLGWYAPVVPVEPVTSDAFTGADSTNVIGRASDATLGGAPAIWEGTPDGAGRTMGITSGTLTRTLSHTSGSWRLALPVPVDDYRADFTLLAFPSHDAYIDLRCGASSGTPDCYRLHLRPTRQTSIDKRVGGTSSSLVFLDSFLPEAPVNLGFSVKGSTLTVWLDGVPVKSVTDASIGSGPFFSMNSGAAMTGLSIDNLVITPL